VNLGLLYFSRLSPHKARRIVLLRDVPNSKFSVRAEIAAPAFSSAEGRPERFMFSLSVDSVLKTDAERDCARFIIGVLTDLPPVERARAITATTAALGLDGAAKPRRPCLFKRNDVVRAIKSARDAGVPVTGVEITCKDGTRIRVLGPDASITNELDKWLKEKNARQA
jgi:hypothetical protein